MLALRAATGTGDPVVRLNIVALGAACLVVVDGTAPDNLGVPGKDLHPLLLCCWFRPRPRANGSCDEKHYETSLRTAPDGLTSGGAGRLSLRPLVVACFSLLLVAARAPNRAAPNSRR